LPASRALNIDGMVGSSAAIARLQANRRADK